MLNKNTQDKIMEDKQIHYFNRGTIEYNNKQYQRLAIQTHFIQRNENYLQIMQTYVAPLIQAGDILSISEKVISMCQNRTVEKKDVKLGFWAKFLSKFASKSSAGIGMDEPYKLQLTINLKGLPLVLFASICAAIGKLVGKRGIFYQIVGKEIAGIDGFYSESLFDTYHTLAVLMPENPDKVCDEIKKEIGVDVMIVDANDFGQELWGCSSALKNYSEKELMSMIKDNPAGQDDECTPFILIREAKKEKKNNETKDALEHP